jgi:hypothetical protein
MKWVARMLAVAACLGLGVAVLSELREPAAQTTGQIRVTTRMIESAFVDVGRAGRSPGDMDVEMALVYNLRVSPQAFGHYELVCHVVRGASRTCRGTLHMPRGQIVVGGSMRHRALYQLAVIGGTGLYDGARGTMTVTRLGTRPTRDQLVVRLIG